MTETGIIAWCDRVIRLGFYLLFGLVPLLLTPWNYELFEYNKMMMVYALTVVIVASWLVKMIAQKEIRIAKTPLDIPILLFLSSQFLSSLFSIDPHVSWFGYYSRFNGGMLSIISYVLLYYAFVSNWTNTSHLTNLLKSSLSTASVIALYAVAERLGVDKNLWVQDVQNRVFSTLGQPNWLAAYLVALIPLSWSFTFKSQKFLSLSSLFWLLISILFFTVLLFTRSRSGLLGFAVADIIFWGILFIRRSSQGAKENQSLALKKAIGMNVLFVFIVFIVGTGSPAIDTFFSLSGLRERLSKQAQPIKNEATSSAFVAPALETGGTESGVIRKYVWEGAVNAWKSSRKTKLIGTGTETFAFAFYQFRPVGHNTTSEWDFLYNKAHNEYLNYLATTGVLGLASYLFFIGVFIWWFITVHGKKKANLPLNYEPFTINSGLFAGWASILITNFFGFSVVVMQLFLFLFPVMIVISNKREARSYIFKINLSSGFSNLLRLTILLVLVVLLVLLSRMWYADTVFATGYRLNRAGSFGQSKNLLSIAASLNPNEPFYHDELGTALAGLTTDAIEKKEATIAATLAQESIRESDIALATSPRNVNFWKSRTKIFYAFSSFDPQFNTAAIKSLEKALDLSPNDPKIVYNLAILEGREGQNDKAIDYLKKAIELKRDYRDAYYALSIFYTETKQGALAKAILQEYLTNVDPLDKDFQERLKQ